MMNINTPNSGTNVRQVSPDPFETALDALRSLGVGFEVVGDFSGVEPGPDMFERAA